MKALTTALTLTFAWVLATNAEAVVIVGGPATTSPFSPTLANGNFEVDAFPAGGIPFENVSNWHNIEGPDNSVNFGQTQGFGGSPEVNSQGAFIFGQLAANDVGHTVAAAGEAFDISYSANRFGGGYNGDEVIEVVLFTSTTGVDADTAVGDITILSTTIFGIDAGWNDYAQDNIYTTVAADVGQTVYLGFDVANPTGNAVFPRLDVITWEVTPVPEPSSFVLGLVTLCTCLQSRRRRARNRS